MVKPLPSLTFPLMEMSTVSMAPWTSLIPGLMKLLSAPRRPMVAVMPKPASSTSATPCTVITVSSTVEYRIDAWTFFSLRSLKENAPLQSSENDSNAPLVIRMPAETSRLGMVMTVSALPA